MFQLTHPVEYQRLDGCILTTLQNIARHSLLDWKEISIYRDSPSHRVILDGHFQAVDIVPDLPPRLKPGAASPRMASNSALIGFLVTLYDHGMIHSAVFVENNHLHIDALHFPGVYTKDRAQSVYYNEKGIDSLLDALPQKQTNIMTYRSKYPTFVRKMQEDDRAIYIFSPMELRLKRK